jgi:hypothetical protein
MRVWMGLCIATLALGCRPPLKGDAYYDPIVAHPRVGFPRPIETVEFFSSGPPSRPHVDVGLVRTQPAPRGVGLVEFLRQQAADHGCDAVVLAAIVRASALGTCVMYTDITTPPLGVNPDVGQPCRQAAPGVFACPGSLVCRDGACVPDAT